MQTQDLVLDKGLPVNLDAERFVLGAIIQDETRFARCQQVLVASDFSLDAHRVIWGAMEELALQGERIDRVTVANLLMRRSKLEGVGGLMYLIGLDDGLAGIFPLDSYLQILREKGCYRRLIFTAQKVINMSVTEAEEPSKLAGLLEEELIDAAGVDTVSSGLLGPREITSAYEGGEDAFIDPSKRAYGIKTGFIKFDELTCGLHEGDYVLIAARPSMGKTALALNMAAHISMNHLDPKTVAVFSLEMSRESLLMRLLCSVARVDAQKYRSGYTNAEERSRLRAALQQLHRARLYIDDTAQLTLLDLQGKLRRLKAEAGLGMVVIDYLQLMTTSGRSENRQQEISTLSRGLKLLAKEMAVPFVVLSQLTRGPENRPGDHRPILSDLRESGSLEQDADVVAFVYREEVYKREREDLKGKAKLILAKQRNGPTADVNLVFLKEYTKFENPLSDFDGDGDE